MEDTRSAGATSRRRARLRFAASWLLALVLVAAGLPQVVSVSWHGVLPALEGLHLSELLGLIALWGLGLYVHSFVLTAAAPTLSHRRALTLNVTGSAVANVVPLGGAAGVELNRRMMRAWGIDTRGFAGYTFLTNLWDVGIKLILPVIAVGALAHAGEHVAAPLKLAALGAGVGFLVLVAAAAALLLTPHGPVLIGRSGEQAVHALTRIARRPRRPELVDTLEEIRRQCTQLVANGWLRMSAGMVGYVALQGLLLGWCLHLTGAGNTWVEILAGFALERLITLAPITPGGVGVADLGLVGVLLALGGDPVGVTAGAVLYRVFVFAVEIPVGGGALGIWLLGHRRGLDGLDTRASGEARAPGQAQRIAHVTDVFLPRLGGIETHVDDLVRHQRARGLEADVLSPTPGGGPDPAWVRRIPAARARAVVGEYDVVHVHLSVLSPYSISVARAAMAAGVPTLITVHSMWAGASAIVRLAALASLRRWPVAWSAVSAAAAEAFRRSLGGAPVDVLPNAIDVAPWRLAGAVARSGTDTLTVVSVMRLMPRKRPIDLLRIFVSVRNLVADDRDVRLLVVGDGPMRGRMERFVRRHGLGDVVTITGRVERDEVRTLLRSGAVYLAPAPKESFGLAALEARCAGLPVVASRRSGVGEFVRDRVDGLLVDDDREMAVATATLLTDDALRERIRSHNDRVAPAYDWSEVLDRTAELYLAAGDRVAVPVPTLRAVQV